MSENSQFLVILLLKILTLKLNNSNFRTFSPESSEDQPNSTSILPEMGTKLVAELNQTKSW